MNRILPSRLLVTLLLPALPVGAQTVVEEVHVTGVLREQTTNELAQSVTVVREEALDRITSTNLGETLSSQLGVSSSYFGAGSSRPIIRGLAGPRVRTMENGIDSMDVSTVSVDHAVTVDPLVAEQIEIFRGPTTFLYGSGAVGGVVNTVTNRIPEFAPDDGFDGAFELRGDSAADERTGVIALDGGGQNYAWHFDALSRETDNYEIPGFAGLDEAEEEGHHEDEEGHHEDEEEHHEDELPGLLENSDFSVQSFALGGSWLGDNGFLGVSVSGFDTDYGIPGHHHHEEEGEEHPHDDDEEGHEGEEEGHDDDEEGHEGEEEEAVRVDLQQTRVDIKGGWVRLPGVIEAINLRFGINDYEHTELEGEEVGTRFENDAYEARLELMHKPWGAWDGAFGFQFGERQFSSVGAEAFVPPVDTSTYGLFVIEQRETGNWRISLGARLEYQEQNPSSTAPAVDGTATSLSLAGIRDLGSGYSLAVNAALAERLPVAEELYADGPHLATQTIEIGNPALKAETSQHLDIGIRKTQGDLTWSLTGFITAYDAFIFLRDTGRVDPDEELPIFHFAQQDADLTGFEAELFSPIADLGRGEVDLRVFADYVTGTLSGGEYLPRMPPLRYGSRLQYHDERLIAGFEVSRYDDQKKAAAFEEPTKGYTMINADISTSIRISGGMELELFLKGTNLADEDARKHTSFVKDTVPLPGRNFSAGWRTRF